jgi:DNA-binding transcriptional regulator LsrR (DeoR family)
MSLLAKAKQVTVNQGRIESNQSDEMIELAVAYARHEVTAKQVAKVLGLKEHGVSHRMFSALQTAARKGYIKISK